MKNQNSSRAEFLQTKALRPHQQRIPLLGPGTDTKSPQRQTEWPGFGPDSELCQRWPYAALLASLVLFY
ncbi:MAG: hypothetical protein JNJ50_27735 [Acidobacteria bacterium]|nr:hypothetical protein [Acidobacteriota bacterium]